jgi:hypothetical protein
VNGLRLRTHDVEVHDPNNAAGRDHIWLAPGTFSRWSEGSAHGSGIVYGTAFSMAPLLILAISIAGPVLGDDAAQEEDQATSRTIDTLRPLETRFMIPHSNDSWERHSIMGWTLFKGDFKNARSNTLQRLQAVDQ